MSRDETCPHCGQKIVTDKVRIDQNANTVTRRGKVLELTTFQTDFVFALYRVSPKAMQMKDIIDHVYCGEDPPRNAKGSIRHMVTKLRPKLATLNIEIVNIHGEGYRLDFTEEEIK